MITDTGTTPGGWFQIINSYGTVIEVVHESTVYSVNDTVASFNPLSEVLTGNTVDRCEDVVVLGPNVVIGDAGTLVFPVFGSMTDTPV